MVNSPLRRLSFRLFAGRCLLCLSPNGERRDLCRACADTFPLLGVKCPTCALPLAVAGRCGQCLRKPPNFDDSHAVWEYGFPVDHMISRFKYQGDKLTGYALSELALEHLPGLHPGDTCLLPVPMHWQRRLGRGFNQAELIAAQWAKALNLPLLQTAVKRTRAAPAQQGLKASQRRRNLKAAFTVKDPASIIGKHVVIVDDVMTTGATADSLAVILRRAGARQISVWCLARTDLTH